MNLPTLVIGGGISGITAAVELAEAGRKVVLIEKTPYLGGHVSGFHNYFPKLCPPACGLEINYRRIRSNPRISYYTGAEVTSISGTEGDFTASVKIEPRLINNNCTACGKCAEVCPVERHSVPGSQELQKAAYINGGLSFPLKYTIDHQFCLRESCRKCLDVCAYDAIQLDAESAVVEFHVQRVIVATGWQSYPAELIENYRYSEECDVVSNVEFEHMMAAAHRENRKLGRPSDGALPGRIAFVQCAGSRDLNHLPYCSAVCCSASVKHALTLAEAYPETETEIFYIDLRLSGRNEKLLRKAEQTDKITLTKGKVGKIGRGDEGGRIIVEVEDIMAGKKQRNSFDLVVLATGLVPNPLVPLLSANEYGFCNVNQARGIYPAATCKRPMDVSASVKDATSAAIKSMQRSDE